MLVRGGVARTLFAMAFPMLAGTFAMNAYNLTDTWFVSRLGTPPLAAMGFTFPVVMLLTCISGGIGSGVTTLVSHAIGRKDRALAARLVTHGVLLAMMVTLVVSVSGYLLIDPVFRALGADAAILPLVASYMRVWYFGALTMSLPMLGNGILISAGDSRSASALMIIGTMLNLLLDSIMIFGYLGCPALGITGAALATVISQSVSMCWLLILLNRKHRFLTRRAGGFSVFVQSVRRITTFAVPAILNMVLMPISATVITKLLAGFGTAAVAATGAAGRIEMFAFMVPMALGMSLTPFVSQNYGAQRLDRVGRARWVSTFFALGYCSLIAALFVICAPQMAAVFTRDPAVTPVLISYIRIISFGYGMMEVHRYSGFFLTGMHRPVAATILNAIRVIGLLIPLSYLGAHLWGVTGVFVGRITTDILVGSLGLFWVARTMARAVAQHRAETVAAAG
ncbi:MATE family efflux transporter [bacterium]|nr:MATE family efflux transporter [bacterium]